MRAFRFMGHLAFLVAAGWLLSAIPAWAADRPGPAPGTGDTLSHIQKTGVLRVGVAENAPWALKDRSGQWIGLDVDYVRQLAQDMGWKLELVPTHWTTAIHDLRDRHFDILASGLSVTPQRALSISYSRSYGVFALGLVVNRKSLGPTDLAELQTGSKYRIAALSGTVTEATTKAWLGNSVIVPANDESTTLQDLRNGKLDGLLAEQPLPAAMAKAFPEQLKTLDVSSFGKTAHAFAVRRGDRDLLDVINAWLVYQKASGFIGDRENFWLHSNAWIALM